MDYKKIKRVVLLIVALGIAVFVYNNAGSEIGQGNNIVLSDKGFSPKELTITVGDTVTFTSERGKFFWPASNLHPSHTTYSTFDSMEPVNPDSSWSFTFDKVGSWKFHDHLAPYFTGVLYVVDQGEAVTSCVEGLECWQEEILDSLEKSGLNSAFDVLAQLYREEPLFANSCHFIAHNLGFAGYGAYVLDHTSILTEKTTYCASGFFHGFMEAHLGATGDLEEAQEVCAYIGEYLSTEAPDAALQCYHGIGHGAMETVVAEHGVFSSENEMIEEALKVCAEVSSSDEQLYRCASGIFNGVANFYITGEYGLSVKKRNPLEICAMQPDVYKEPCYGNMNSVLMWMNDNDFVKAAPYIVAIPDEDQKRRAFIYLGGQHALTHLQTTDFTSVVRDCHTIPDEYQLTCIEGFSQGLMEHGVPGEEYRAALSFCETNSMTSLERNTCFKMVLSTLPGWYSLEKSKKICSSVLEEYQTFCTY